MTAQTLSLTISEMQVGDEIVSMRSRSGWVRIASIEEDEALGTVAISDAGRIVYAPQVGVRPGSVESPVLVTRYTD